MRRFILLTFAAALLGFLIRAYFDPTLNPVGLGSDGYEYWHLSSNLLNHQSFAYTDPSHYPVFDVNALKNSSRLGPEIPCTTRVIGYPALLAIVRLIWDSPWSAIGLNILMYIALCLYAFRLTDLWIQPRWARRLVDLLVVFNPLVFTRWGIGSDLAAAFALTAFSYHCVRLLKTPSTVFHLAGCVGFGILTTLMRSNLIVYSVCLTVFLIAQGATTRNRSLIRQSLILFVCLVSSTGLWMNRNRLLTDQWTLSTQGGAVLYTVHLAYSLPEHDPRAYWKKEGKIQFIEHALAQGKTFNQSEALLDRKLKSIVHEYYIHNPLQLWHKLSDGLRTLFFFSYFDISDVLLLTRHPKEQRIAFANASSSAFRGYSKNEEPFRTTLFQISRFYKWLLALGFILCPVILIIQKLRTRCTWPNGFWMIYLSVFISLLSTALFTGAAGDRMRMPWAAILLIVVITTCNAFSSARSRQQPAPTV